jgi:arginyl-tRNA synthetase
MAIDSPNDFSDPEVPKSPREFYMLYFQNMRKNADSFAEINKKIDEMAESHADDMDAILKKFDKWDIWKNCHDIDLQKNLETLTKHSVAIRIVTWIGTIFGAGFITFLIALLTGQFVLVKP